MERVRQSSSNNIRKLLLEIHVSIATDARPDEISEVYFHILNKHFWLHKSIGIRNFKGKLMMIVVKLCKHFKIDN